MVRFDTTTTFHLLMLSYTTYAFYPSTTLPNNFHNYISESAQQRCLEDRNSKRRNTFITYACAAASANSYSDERELNDVVPSSSRSSLAEKDSDEAEKHRARTDLYSVTLPITNSQYSAKPLGVTLRQIGKNTVLSDLSLDLDTLRFISPAKPQEGVQYLDTGLKERNFGKDVEGVIVSSIQEDGLAYEAGVRVADVLVATSATIGDKMWPKSTLDGVRSAISSRKNLLKDMTFQFRRNVIPYVDTDSVVEEFDMELRRPIGIQVANSDKGYVYVTNITNPALSTSLAVGDRIISINSNFGSNKDDNNDETMWPISSVEGLISATTSRFPNQPIRLRFQRVVKVSEDEDSLEGAIKGFRTWTQSHSPSSLIKETTNTHDMLLSRCRDTLRRYLNTEQDSTKESRLSALNTVPGLVADRVMEALHEAAAPLDASTLTLIMNAYTLCQMQEKAIEAFEIATGLSATGSGAASIKQPNGGIVKNADAANVYTGTALLKCHSMNGDYTSAMRVLAAMEGRQNYEVNGIKSEPWPTSTKLKVDAQCYNIVLSSAVKGGDIEMALSVFDSMMDPYQSDGSSIVKTSVSYNTMISAFVKTNSIQDALTLFYSMKQNRMKADKYTYTSILKALLNDGDWNGVGELLAEMKEYSIPSDVITYNTIIQGMLTEKGKWYEAQKLVNDMELQGISPNSFTYGLLMNGLLKANKPGPCLTLFESAALDPRTTALTENVQLYTTAITAASRLGDYDRALDLLSRMKKVGVKPNLKTLTALIVACLNSQRYEMATNIFQQISNPDGYVYSLGVRAFCEAGEFDNALNILKDQGAGFKEMNGKEIMFSFNYLINAALRHGCLDKARDALTLLLRNGYIPSKSTYKTILEGLNIDLPYQNHRRNNKKVETKDSTSMSMLRQKLPLPQQQNEIQENKHASFEFLLFVLDAVAKRNTPVDAMFYSSVVLEGKRLGGLPRKFASLLVNARRNTLDRSYSDSDRENTVVIKADKLTHHHPKEQQTFTTTKVSSKSKQPSSSSWEQLFQQWDTLKKRSNIEENLPNLHVRVGNRDFRSVLFAEQNTFDYRSRKNRGKAVRR